MNGNGIDTSAMLTMLALIAAVWAVVPATRLLSFRFALAWWDWVVIWSIIVAIHALYFEPVLRQLHAYPNLGPWSWGFDKGGAQYLLFLMLTAYIYVRSRRVRLSRRKLPLFARLTASLLYARKFEDLAALLADHLRATLALTDSANVRAQLEGWLRPAQSLSHVAIGEDGLVRIVKAPSPPAITQTFHRVREQLAHVVGPAKGPQQQARVLVNRLLSSRDLVGYLALTRPQFCVEVMEQVDLIVEEFQDIVFQAMLADESSILYAEIKNSQNLAGAQGHRLALPEENHLLFFYLKDIDVAARLGVYRSIGEAVISQIDSDEGLATKLNGPLLTYQEVGKFRCPVHVGVVFFRLMILEGLHQRSTNHLWLHYFPHFSARLVSRARQLEDDDENHEFPTPLSYLLYELVDGTCAWIDDASRLTEHGDIVSPDTTEGRHVYISFEAAEALGRVLEPIFRSDRVTSGLKAEFLSVVLGLLRRVGRHAQLSELVTALTNAVINPYGYRSDASYLNKLGDCYAAQDHVLRAQTVSFHRALAQAVSEGCAEDGET